MSLAWWLFSQDLCLMAFSLNDFACSLSSKVGMRRCCLLYNAVGKSGFTSYSYKILSSFLLIWQKIWLESSLYSFVHDLAPYVEDFDHNTSNVKDSNSVDSVKSVG